MEVAFLPDVTVVEFEADDPMAASTSMEPPQPVQPHQHKRVSLLFVVPGLSTKFEDFQPTTPTYVTETIERTTRERVRYRSYKDVNPNLYHY